MSSSNTLRNGEYTEEFRDYENRGIIFFISHRALCRHVLQLYQCNHRNQRWMPPVKLDYLIKL